MNSGTTRLRPAILIISETAFQDPSLDQSEFVLRQVLGSEGDDRWTEPLVEVVPDDAWRIQRAVRGWTDDENNYVNLVITTGGTGFAVKDITPEVSCLYRKGLQEHFVLHPTTLLIDVQHRPLRLSSIALPPA